MPDVSTEVALATTTLGSATNTITFSTIPATYTDLRLIFIGKQDVSGSDLLLRYNGDTGSNYSMTWIEGNGSTASSSRTTSATRIQVGAAFGLQSGNSCFCSIDIFSYAGSTYKTCLASYNLDNNGTGATSRNVGLWRNTNAITSVTFTVLSDNFAIGTTATLYGIL